MQGSYAGNAVGFKLESLLEVLNAKGESGKRLVDGLAETDDGDSTELFALLDALALTRYRNLSNFLMDTMDVLRSASGEDFDKAIVELLRSIATARFDNAEAGVDEQFRDSYDAALQVDSQS